MSERLTARVRAARVHEQYRKQVLSSGGRASLEKLIAEEMGAFEHDIRKEVIAQLQEAGKKYSEDDVQKQVEKHQVRLEKKYAASNKRLIVENERLKEHNLRLKSLDVVNRSVIRDANAALKAGKKVVRASVKEELVREGLISESDVANLVTAAEKTVEKKLVAVVAKHEKVVGKLKEKLLETTSKLKDAEKALRGGIGASAKDIKAAVDTEKERILLVIEKTLDITREKLVKSVSLQASKGAINAPKKTIKKQ